MTTHIGMTTTNIDKAVTSNVADSAVDANGPSIHQRMVAILADLPPIGKDQRNEQQGFMFRGHDDVLNALNPLLAKHGVVIVPEVLERIPAQRTTSRGNVMFEVNLHVRYRFYGEDGSFIQASAWGEGTDSGDKATNKAMTMAFKNVLNQAFAISNKETADADAHTPDDSAGREPRASAATRSDPAAANSGPSRPDEPKPKLASAGQKKKLDVLVGTLRSQGHLTTADVYRNIGYDPIVGADGELHWSDLREQLTAADAHLLIDMLERFAESVRAPGETKLPLPNEVRESMR